VTSKAEVHEKPEIIEVRFKTPEEGGRNTPVVGDVYSCPLFVDAEGFDCRGLLGKQRIELGNSYKLPVKFLNRDSVIPKLSPGKPVTLWEGQDVASGAVLEIADTKRRGDRIQVNKAPKGG
jgi:hypothetical protein